MNLIKPFRTLWSLLAITYYKLKVRYYRLKNTTWRRRVEDLECSLADGKHRLFKLKREQYLACAKLAEGGPGEAASALAADREVDEGDSAFPDSSCELVTLGILQGMTMRDYLESESARAWLDRHGDEALYV